MNPILGSILFIVTLILGSQCHSNVDQTLKEQCEDDTCLTMDGPCFIPREIGVLKRLDGVKVGLTKF